MKITRLYSDSDGDSHFQEIDVPLHEGGPIGRLSDRVGARQMILRETGGDYDYDFHTAPERQFIFNLDGTIEIETSLGERRRFGAGDILFVEDTHGKGHRTRSVDGRVRRSAFVTVGDAPLPF